MAYIALHIELQRCMVVNGEGVDAGGLLSIVDVCNIIGYVLEFIYLIAKITVEVCGSIYCILVYSLAGKPQVVRIVRQRRLNNSPAVWRLVKFPEGRVLASKSSYINMIAQE